jgi:HD superfamily phosphohydrolase
MPQTRWMTMADPIHGIIRFDRHNPTHRLLLDVMNSKPFQRLRRIKQMGMAEFVFPGATHSRFVHSLGATHLMMQALDCFNTNPDWQALLESAFEDTGIPLSQLLLLGILIHDIGHTPLSHTLEDILDLKEQGLLHDEYWNRKILTESADLQAIWERHNPKIPEAVLRFMGDGADKHFLAQLVSSQLDMDRLDYLQRDSHYLGVQYGRIEADRIIANMAITHLKDGRPTVALREEAIPAIEHYLFGRHQAYKMALHSLDKASEALLKQTLRRFRWVTEHNADPGLPRGHSAPSLYQLMVDGRQLSVDEFLRMDDCYLWDAIHTWASISQDPLLYQLSNRLMQHEIFKFVDLGKYGYFEPFHTLAPVYEALQTHYHQRGLCFDFGFEETWVKPKPMYQVPPAREPIWIKSAQGVVDLREVSSLPLESDPHRGQKHLLFVWDREARRFLTEALDRYFGMA